MTELTEFPTKLNALPEDSRADKRVAFKARKVFAAIFSPFVRAMRECMTAYTQARAEGVERADAAKGIEQTLRDLWPKPTTQYGPQCLICDDLGYEELLCRQWARCERPNCQRKGEDWQHLYVVPCSCHHGDKHRPKVCTTEDALAAVGKVPKRKGGFSRMGQ